MKNTIKLAATAALGLGFTSVTSYAGSGCGSCDGDKKSKKSYQAEVVTTEAKADKNLVQIAAGNKDFSTLVAAVKAAGLAEALSGAGPFTIFAPTNEAFAKLPEGTVATLLKPENKDKLAKILKYHVVPAKIMAADVKPGEVKSLDASTLEIKVSDGAVHIDNAKVISTDIVGTNGVIHVIDTVIMP